MGTKGTKGAARVHTRTIAEMKRDAAAARRVAAAKRASGRKR